MSAITATTDAKDLMTAAYTLGATADLTAELPGGRTALVIPEGAKLSIVEPLEPELTRIRQKAVFDDAVSFSAYVNLFKIETTRLFAKGGEIKAVIDYHNPNTNPHDPSYCAHVATFAPALSDQWAAWCDAEPMTQVEFAEFVEERRADIIQPEAASLLDIVTRFRASKKTDYDSVVYQPNGDVTVAYSEKTDSAGKPGVPVPTELRLGIPVYFRGRPYEVPVLMRYRLNDGKLTFVVKVDRRRLIEDAAFEDVITNVAAETGIEVYRGRLV
jgi:uncharacterized protein YfdQ (DUF2303 family)